MLRKHLFFVYSFLHSVCLYSDFNAETHYEYGDEDDDDNNYDDVDDNDNADDDDDDNDNDDDDDDDNVKW